MEQRANKKNQKTRGTWWSTLKILRQYWPNDVALAAIEKRDVIGFRDHLAALKGLADSSKSLYLTALKTTLKDAYKLDYLSKDFTAYIEPIKSNPAQKEYLTLEELEHLAVTPCERLDLRNAFLFSAMSGLRYSDIFKLMWGEVQGDEETGFALRYRQQKTQKNETLPISKGARALLGPAGLPNDKVFPTLPEKIFANNMILLQRWFLAAGISKKITFH
ncbi:MAG TPA: phage integrase SAM-like domain-containing protein, partial [Saprospiraceae bacterium]|nr:phage integrase SAM-like domain-containing protein [Saprospiraceae bacterium]